MIADYARHHRSAVAYQDQRQQLESLLLADGIREFEWFIDNADGISSERPALDRLRRAIPKGDVESAYFCSLDRLSRDLNRYGKPRQPLSDHRHAADCGRGCRPRSRRRRLHD
jgi:DNA invertase Pin-like site-specific DNA recombinase